MKIRFYIFLFFSFFFMQTANALINLELTQGVRSALPIAIVSFQNEESLPADLQTSMIINHDLSNSGEFHVFTGNQLPQQPHTLSDIQASRWHGFAPQYVVIGDITSLGADQYKVNFSLVNLYRSQNSERISSSAVVLSKTYTVNKTQLRRLAHQISNEIYQALLNTPGIFTSRIAYILVQPSANPKQPNYHLVVADYDGYNPRYAANSNEPMMSPAWSPDGQQIAFVSFQKTLPAIFIANLRTGGLQQITALAGINGAPAWSPNGKELAFVSSQTGSAKLYTIDLVTRNITRLTDGYSIDTESCYMPDGQSLVFTSNRGGTPQIYEYTFAKKNIERLTYVGDYNASANISPDGKLMAVLHRDKNGFNIAVQNLKTDHFQILTHDNHDESPKFSSNSKLILYATEKTLAIVSSDGQINILLPASEGSVREPTWAK